METRLHCVTVEPIPGRNIRVGRTAFIRKGHETPDTVSYVCVTASFDFGTLPPNRGDEIDIQLGLTPRQMAQIVWVFFESVITDKKSIYARFFRRLMKRRWTVMTRSDYQSGAWQGYEGTEDIMYHRDERAVRPLKQAAA